MQILSVVPLIMPPLGKGVRDHVENGDVSLHKWHVIVFDERINDDGRGKVSVAAGSLPALAEDAAVRQQTGFRHPLLDLHQALEVSRSGGEEVVELRAGLADQIQQHEKVQGIEAVGLGGGSRKRSGLPQLGQVTRTVDAVVVRPVDEGLLSVEEEEFESHVVVAIARALEELVHRSGEMEHHGARNG